MSMYVYICVYMSSSHIVMESVRIIVNMEFPSTCRRICDDSDVYAQKRGVISLSIVVMEWISTLDWFSQGVGIEPKF